MTRLHIDGQNFDLETAAERIAREHGAHVPGGSDIARYVADRAHEDRMRRQQEQIEADRAAEVAQAARDFEERVAGPLRGRRTPEHLEAVADAERRLYGDRTPEERAALEHTERQLGERRGFDAETERQAEEVRAFLEPKAGRSTPSAGPWRDEADRTREELFGPEEATPATSASPREPQAAPRARDANDPRALKGSGRAPRPGEAGLPPSLRGRAGAADRLPPMAPASEEMLRGMADSSDPQERSKLRHAVERQPALLEVLTVDQRRRLAEEARP